MTLTEMYRFNEEAAESEEMQRYLDMVFQQLIDGLSEKINEDLEKGILELSLDLNTYAKSKGYEYSEDESIAALQSAFPGFREKVHESIETSTLAFQQQLLKEVK